MHRSILFVVALCASSACTAPIRVVQIADPATPAKGIRYTLKRPSHQLGLQLADEKKCKIQVVVVQKMDRRRYFEVRRPNLFALPFHALSNANFSIRLDDDGALTTATVNEDDQSLEFLKAVAELAAKSAKLATLVADLREPGGSLPPPPEAPDCSSVLPNERMKEGFAVYAKKWKALDVEKGQLVAARKGLLSGLAAEKALDQKRSLEVLPLLDAAIKEAGKRQEALFYRVSAQDGRLTFGAKDEGGAERGAGDGAASYWLDVNMQPEHNALRGCLAGECR